MLPPAFMLRANFSFFLSLFPFPPPHNQKFLCWLLKDHNQDVCIYKVALFIDVGVSVFGGWRRQMLLRIELPTRIYYLHPVYGESQ